MRPLALLTLGTAFLYLSTTTPIVGAQGAPTVAPPGTVDEVVVTRQRLSSMRRELEHAQEDLYKVFNANTSDHELDMHCSQEMPTGSRVSRRVCRPAFVDTATSQGAWDLMTYMLGHCPQNSAICPVNDIPLEMGAALAQQPLGKIPFMAKRLDQEMERLVRENPDVAKAFANYQGKERAYPEALTGQAKK